MANNTLTNLIPDAYAALDVVSRELVGFVPSVARDPKADRVAQNQNLRIPQTVANTAGLDITPSMTLPSEANQTVGNQTLTLTKARAYPFSWSGEEEYAVNQGAGYLTIKQNQIAQAMRGLVNEIETDIANAAYLNSSRAYGTAGTTPFGTNLGESAQVRKILDDNGAPGSDRSIVMNTAAGASLRTLLNNPLNANTSLNGDITAQGVIMDLNGFKFRESAQVATVASGAMASATTSSASLTVGQTVLPLATAGTGVVAAGDIITLANDSNKYVVVSVSFAGSNPASGDSITIAAPGLKVAQASATRAITVVATAARNVAFSRNAILLATRLPELPEEGDLARFREVITDDRSGISFEIAAYPGYRKITYQIAAVWGVKVIKPEHSAILLG
jgi:hypothetical protein